MLKGWSENRTFQMARGLARGGGNQEENEWKSSCVSELFKREGKEGPQFPPSIPSRTNIEGRELHIPTDATVEKRPPGKLPVNLILQCSKCRDLEVPTSAEREKRGPSEGGVPCERRRACGTLERRGGGKGRTQEKEGSHGMTGILNGINPLGATRVCNWN